MSLGCVAQQHLVSIQCFIVTVDQFSLNEGFVLNVNSSLTFADIELKEAQRFFAQKFSCGASVTAEDEIIIQGDFTDDIIDVIQEKWPEVRVLNLQMHLWFILPSYLSFFGLFTRFSFIFHFIFTGQGSAGF